MASIVDALRDPSSFGALPAFGDLSAPVPKDQPRPASTWDAWLAFLRAVYGLPMSEAEVAVFRKHTGRTSPRVGGYAEAVAVVGVRSGKSRIAGLIASFEASTARADGGEPLYALLLAQDHRGAMRTLQRYAALPFETVPALMALVPAAQPLRRLLRRIAQREDALTLTTGVVIASYPCRPAAVRGLGAVVVVVDELAHFITSDGRPTDREMLRVARGRVATTGGKVIVLSSPYAEAGALWDLHRQHYGREDSPTLVWQASAPDMNPTLPADYLARMREEDPDAYRSEVLGEFRAGVAALFDPEALEACVDRGVRERLIEGPA